MLKKSIRMRIILSALIISILTFFVHEALAGCCTTGDDGYCGDRICIIGFCTDCGFGMCTIYGPCPAQKRLHTSFVGTCNGESFSCSYPGVYGSCFCDKSCGAECTVASDCPASNPGYSYCSSYNQCRRVSYYCNGDCSCASQETVDNTCINLCPANGWVNTGNYQWVSTGDCTEKQQVQQELRSYTCSGGGCTYSVTNYQWVDTGNTRNKVDGTVCADDGLVCTDDVCSSGICTHPLKSGWCWIGGCVASGTLNPTNDCQICDPTQSYFKWSNRPNGVACGSQHCSDSAVHFNGDITANVWAKYQHNGACPMPVAGSSSTCVYSSINCDIHDTDSCSCTISNPSLIDACHDFECVPLSGSICTWTGDWLTINSWACDSSKVGSTQSCRGTTYYCCGGGSTALYCNKGGQTYFQDKISLASYQWQTSACSYSYIDANSICRSSGSLQAGDGCTADSQCNGVTAGTGNCNGNCKYTVCSRDGLWGDTHEYKCDSDKTRLRCRVDGSGYDDTNLCDWPNCGAYQFCNDLSPGYQYNSCGALNSFYWDRCSSTCGIEDYPLTCKAPPDLDCTADVLCDEKAPTVSCGSGGTCTATCTCFVPALCSENDGGNSPLTAGTCTDTIVHSDSCSGTTLTEYYCSGATCAFTSKQCQDYETLYCNAGNIYREEWQCSGSPGYCNNGAANTLVQTCSNTCSDTDGGQTYTTQGTVTDNNLCSAGQTSCPSSSYTDYCVNAATLREYYCSGSDYTFTDYSCANLGVGYTCSGGICVTGPQVSITITSSPTGSGYVVVDSISYSTPQTFSWTVVSTHTISANSPVSCGSGCQDVFTSWSDGGSQSHSITTPAAATTYTANYQRQYYLTMQVSPAGSGIVSPGSGWRNSGSSVSISATANSGYTFTSWSDGGAQTHSITVSSAMTRTANFNPIVGTSITITSSPNTGAGYVTVDGTAISTPQTFTWTFGSSHTITATNNAGCTFTSWSDGGSQSHSITTPAAATTYTANFNCGVQCTSSLGNKYNPGQWCCHNERCAISDSFCWHCPNDVLNCYECQSDGTWIDRCAGGTVIYDSRCSDKFTNLAYGDNTCTGGSGWTCDSSCNCVAPATYSATFSQTGIPAGTTWSVTVGGILYTSTSSSVTPSGLLSGTVAYSYNSTVSGASGTRYICNSGCSGSVSSSTTVTASYGTQYYLTMQAGSGGTVSPASGWYNSGSSVSISATANSGYTFTSWSDGGAQTHSITVSGPITMIANFLSLFTITITSSPSTGAGYVTVDGSPITTPQSYSWVQGSTHTIAAISPVSCGFGCQYVFTSWSDGGAQSHSITVSATATYTANFQRQYYLTMQVSPAGSGTVSPGSGWRNSGSSVSISATANSGYTFTSWSDGGAQTHSITINSAITETANFLNLVTVTSSPSTGPGFVRVDGAAITTPQTFSWAQGSSHTISANSPVSCGVGCQFYYSSWSDGGLQSHGITISVSGTYTANFQRQYYLTMLANPTTGGTVTPSSGWRNVGTPVGILATSTGSCMFASWTGIGTGSYTGINDPATVTMNDPITETANFACGTANSMNFTGYLNYSNNEPVKNSLIKMTIKNNTLGYEKSGIDETDQLGFFFVKIENIPDTIMNSNLDISIYVLGDVEALYDCWYNHTSGKCCSVPLSGPC